MHEPIFEIRDPVHGFIKLTGAERSIVNCPTFQRLRDIRQLAMGHMVYPGANHTRFEHSIGCLHLSTLVLDLLTEREGKEGRPTFRDVFAADKETVERGKRILRLGSLLHDIGHPPFSHSGEGLLPTVQMDGHEKRLDHEYMSAQLIRETEIADVIREDYKDHGISLEDVITVATKPGLPKDQKADAWMLFLNEILTGELGSDRMDYLLRDAHHSGQGSGIFDCEKLLNAMTLVPNPESRDRRECGLGLDEGGWLVAEQMVVARYLMYIALYFHKTKRIYEMHLEDFMGNWLQNRYQKPHLPSDPKEYSRFTDSAVLQGIAEAYRDEKHPAHEHAKPFWDRSHFRLAKELVLADNYKTMEKERRIPDKERFDRLWEEVRIKLGQEGVKRDSPDHSATKMFYPDTKILVLLEGKARYLDDLSEIVRGMSSRIWRGRIYAAQDKVEGVKATCQEYLERDPQKRGEAGGPG